MVSRVLLRRSIACGGLGSEATALACRVVVAGTATPLSRACTPAAMLVATVLLALTRIASLLLGLTV